MPDLKKYDSMAEAIEGETSLGFYILMRAHDHVWAYREGFDLETRIESCALIWALALRLRDDNDARAQVGSGMEDGEIHAL